MKNSIVYSIVILSLMSFSNCNVSTWTNCIKGEGEVVSRSFDIPHFDQINVANSADVVFIHGKEQKVEVKGQANIIDELTLTVKNEECRIDFDKNVCFSKDFTVYITVPSIKAVRISGSSDVSSQSTFTEDEFAVSISGSGDVAFDINASKIGIRIGGSGDVDLEGNAEDIDISITGSGDVNVYKVDASSAAVSIVGSGDIYVNSSESLKIDIIGSGDVYYKGNPTNKDINTIGSGDVIPQ